MLRRTFLSLMAVGAGMAMAGQARAAEHQVQMLDRGEGGAMVFVPALVRARVGDTIRYVPTHRGHNAETIAGMLPPGVAVTRGAMGQEYVLTVTRPGVYGIKCAPHYGMGMIGLVVVGDGSPNRTAAEEVAGRAPGIARRRFADLFGRL